MSTKIHVIASSVLAGVPKTDYSHLYVYVKKKKKEKHTTYGHTF